MIASSDVDFGTTVEGSSFVSSVGVGSGVVVGVVCGQSCAGEATEPVTGTVSGCVTGSVMMLLLLGSLGRVCGAHGADTALSAAGAGTVSAVSVPPQIAQHRGKGGEDCSDKNSALFHDRLPPKFW